MAEVTADVLRDQGPGSSEVERLNPELSTVQVGDRLRFTLQIPFLSPEYVREFLFTAFPFLGTAGAHLDLGPYLEPDPSTAAFDFANGYMVIEADVIREASPGVPLILVISAMVLALAALFPSVTVVLVERLSRAAEAVGGAVGSLFSSFITGVGSGTAQAIGLPGIAMLLLVAGAVVLASPTARAALRRRV